MDLPLKSAGTPNMIYQPRPNAEADHHDRANSEREESHAQVLAKKVFEGVRDEIVRGSLQPGQAFSRRQIAARYGVSYTPVIEALAQLEQTGLIESHGSRMACVRQLSVESIRNDYILREAVETQAIRLACKAAKDEEINDLSRTADALDAYAVGREFADAAGAKLHWSFHRRICEISRCTILANELERFLLRASFALSGSREAFWERRRLENIGIWWKPSGPGTRLPPMLRCEYISAES